MPLTSGTTLGPYKIEAPLGAGGMGEVYKARDSRLDRTVAVKVLPEDVTADPDLKQPFEREARTVASSSGQWTGRAASPWTLACCGHSPDASLQRASGDDGEVEGSVRPRVMYANGRGVSAGWKWQVLR